MGQKKTEMEIKVNEILNYHMTGYKDKLVQCHILHGDTLDACFRQVYAIRRSGRYDSARRYAFEDASLETAYRDWKQNTETIEMFYGSATVD